MGTCVAVCDDTAATRIGLEHELTAQGFRVVTATSPAALPPVLAGHPVDVVVCDLYLDGTSGFPALGLIRDLAVDGWRVLVHSTWAIDPDILAALDAGALGYLQKGPSLEPLCGAIERVASMRPGEAPLMTAEIAGAVRRRERFGLTEAEMEVLTYVSQHLTNAEIARLRYVSEDTVKTQVASIRGKLGSASRNAAVRTARQHGLLGRWLPGY